MLEFRLMNIKILCLCITVSILNIACSHHTRSISASASLKPFLPVNKGNIIQPALCQKGGLIQMIPFQAGPNVEANAELDQASLMMIRGVHDVLTEKQSSPFQVVIGEKGNTAPFVLKGYITMINEPGKWERWVWHHKSKKIAVQGYLIDRQTGEKVLVFEDTVGSKDPLGQLGHELGLRIGRFLLEAGHGAS